MNRRERIRKQMERTRDVLSTTERNDAIYSRDDLKLVGQALNLLLTHLDHALEFEEFLAAVEEADKQWFRPA